MTMNIALIAHDAKKKLMQNFCIAYRGILSKNELYATGTTGKLVEEVTNLSIHKFLGFYVQCYICYFRQVQMFLIDVIMTQ